MIDGSWREKSFAGYDAVYHVAGIAHSDNGKISEEKKKLIDEKLEAEKKAQEASEELERLKNRSFWQRLRNK